MKKDRKFEFNQPLDILKINQYIYQLIDSAFFYAPNPDKISYKISKEKNTKDICIMYNIKNKEVGIYSQRFRIGAKNLYLPKHYIIRNSLLLKLFYDIYEINLTQEEQKFIIDNIEIIYEFLKTKKHLRIDVLKNIQSRFSGYQLDRLNAYIVAMKIEEVALREKGCL